MGAAELWFESQSADPEHDTWAEFRDALVTRFREDHFSERLEEELRSMRQRRDETVSAYAERFRYLHSQGDGLPTLDVLARYWVRGLRGKRARTVFLRSP